MFAQTKLVATVANATTRFRSKGRTPHPKSKKYQKRDRALGENF